MHSSIQTQQNTTNDQDKQFISKFQLNLTSLTSNIYQTW